MHEAVKIWPNFIDFINILGHLIYNIEYCTYSTWVKYKYLLPTSNSETSKNLNIPLCVFR